MPQNGVILYPARGGDSLMVYRVGYDKVTTQIPLLPSDSEACSHKTGIRPDSAGWWIKSIEMRWRTVAKTRGFSDNKGLPW